MAVNVWLKAVMSKTGPLPQRLRHACHVLACFMRGDGAEGCFPSQRTVGDAMGVSHRTAGRDLGSLEQRGWIQSETVRRQFGKVGRRYFPAVPLDNGTAEHVPINSANGTPSVTHADRNGTADRVNGTNREEIGTNGERIGTPSVSLKSLTEISTEKSAASPSPAIAGSAAPKPDLDLHDQVTALRALGWSDERILAKWKAKGMTEAHLREAKS
ncbi:MAG TPA: hypothetical protein VMU40_02500 [Steroidobacteraceae bacterium]|nr:hypothetical protein [Steroidobacteraceae bacterium]